jgi:hypothetical protein
MQRTYLVITAFGEGGTGLLLLALPSVPLALLLGVDQGSPEVVFFTRIAGAALVALGVACWVGRNDLDRPAQKGVLLGVLIYDVVAAGILAYTGAVLGLAGIVLWPAVGLHAALAVWCAACLRGRPTGQRGDNP